MKKTKKIKPDELWSLDWTIADFVLPRLVAFRKLPRRGYPIKFSSLREWNRVLDKMIYSFQMVLDGKNYLENSTQKKIKEGFILFGEHFQALWD